MDYSPWDCKRVRHDLVTKQHNTTTTLIWSGFKKHFGLNLVDRGPRGFFAHTENIREKKASCVQVLRYSCWIKSPLNVFPMFASIIESVSDHG